MYDNAGGTGQLRRGQRRANAAITCPIQTYTHYYGAIEVVALLLLLLLLLCVCVCVCV